MADDDPQAGGLYRWSGWTVAGVAQTDRAVARLTETHEYFHRQLDDTTAFGGLVAVYASLAVACPGDGWERTRDRLQAMSDVLHETHAVGMSLLTSQRRLERIDGYPLYDRYINVLTQLVGEQTHPWVALAALRAAATACMQSTALTVAGEIGLDSFQPQAIALTDRPNHRLVQLIRSPFREEVAREQAQALAAYAAETWWIGSDRVPLTPESTDGHAGRLSQQLQARLFKTAAGFLASSRAQVLDEDGHHNDLRELLAQARALAPEGLARIGALVESGGGDLLHGGALDSQTITLPAAPRRATVLPYGSISGMSGEGESRHGFVAVARPERLRSFYELGGVDLPDQAAVACLRTTVFDGPVRDSVLLVIVDEPESIEQAEHPIFVSVSSSAAAAAPEMTARWMGYARRDRLSLVMDTPATAALHRWCEPDSTRFRAATRQIDAHGVDLRIIAGRIEQDGRQSPLVIIPTTEFGARWFEAATEEDPKLKRSVVIDPGLFEEESVHMDIVLTHLILEEPVVGTGSWNA
jgi:hypothetical protein